MPLTAAETCDCCGEAYAWGDAGDPRNEIADFIVRDFSRTLLGTIRAHRDCVALWALKTSNTGREYVDTSETDAGTVYCVLDSCPALDVVG